jgi:TRAP-type C4-dicarboxylate transport system permease small subunit
MVHIRTSRAAPVPGARPGTATGRVQQVPSMTDTPELEGLAALADRLSQRLGWLTDRVAAGLLLLLVLDVWLGVLVRYLVPLPITFMEEAARYLMIWVALLAVSSCIPRREHIGVQVLFERLPSAARRVLLGLLDVLGIAFFMMIYGMSKALPFAAVPVGAALAALQLALVAVRDQARLRGGPLQVVFP